MQPEVKDEYAEIYYHMVYRYPLPFTPCKVERKEMSKEAKKEFYAMPDDVQNWYRRFKPALGEPEVDTRNPDDEQLWFSKTPFVAVPNEKPPTLAYGMLDFEAKSHLDYHDPGSLISNEEYEAWQDHLESLPPEKQCLIKMFIDPPIDIEQPSTVGTKVQAECIGSGLNRPWDDESDADWKLFDHLQSLHPEKLRLIKLFLDPPIDIGQPSPVGTKVQAECVGSGLKSPLDDECYYDWELFDHLLSLPPERQRLVKLVIDAIGQPSTDWESFDHLPKLIDIEQPSTVGTKVQAECVGSGLKRPWDDEVGSGLKRPWDDESDAGTKVQAECVGSGLKRPWDDEVGSGLKHPWDDESDADWESHENLLRLIDVPIDIGQPSTDWELFDHLRKLIDIEQPSTVGTKVQAECVRSGLKKRPWDDESDAVGTKVQAECVGSGLKRPWDDESDAVVLRQLKRRKSI